MFGHSPPGMWVSSLPGTEVMDGSIFLKGASSFTLFLPCSAHMRATRAQPLA